MKRRFFIPPWLFLAVVAVYDEGLLHWWTAQRVEVHRVVTVLIFALPFGLLLGLLLSFFSRPQWAKGAAVAAASVLAVLYFGMYVIYDTYQEFLTPGTLISGAGGVASDFLAIALTAVFRNLWRLAVLGAPIVCYLSACRGMVVTWQFRVILAAAGAALYLLGFGAVRLFGADAPLLGSSYRFDGAVRAFGLHMGLALEAVHSVSPSDAQPEFLPTEETAPTETLQPTAPQVIYEPQTLGLDFDSLAEAEENSGIRALHRYAAEQTPALKNEFTGLFAGKNLIFITAEAFSKQVIDPVRTPTLYRLANQGIRFEAYYQPAWGGSTTAGEFSNLIGLVPIGGGKCMEEALEQDLFLTIGAGLKKLGYYSTAYHNHSYTYYNRDETHTRLGYDRFVAMGNGMEEGVAKNVPESDVEMMEFTAAQYLDQQPFSIYYMTMSGHALYSRGGNAMARKNYHRVADLDYPEAVKCYLAANLELEDAITSLVRQLEEAGIADDTVIVLASDHYPYALEKSSAWGNDRNYLKDLYGAEKVDCFIRDRSELIIWCGSLEEKKIVVEEPVYSLDILPTLLNLFDIPYDSRLLVGRDVFSEAEPLVLWPDRSWRTEYGFYNAGNGQFTPEPGIQVEDGYVRRISAIVSNKIAYCEGVCKHDYFNVLSPLVQ